MSTRFEEKTITPNGSLGRNTMRVNIIDGVFADFDDVNTRLRALPFSRRPQSDKHPTRYRDAIRNLPQDMIEEMITVTGATEVVQCQALASYGDANGVAGELNHRDGTRFGCDNVLLTYMQDGTGDCLSFLDNDETVNQTVSEQANRGVQFSGNDLHRGENMDNFGPKGNARIVIAFFYN